MRKTSIARGVLGCLAAALAVAVGAPASARAEDASLRVTVRDSFGIIPHATVRATSQPSGTSHRATTDADGVASLTALPAGSYEVRASFPGFADTVEPKVTLAAGEKRTLDLVLSQAQFSTSVTVTTANRREQLLLDVAQPTTLVDLAQIQDTGARSARDVLVEQAGSGIQVNAGGGQGHISLNGIPNSGVLVLVNGRRYLGKDANGNLNLEDLQLVGVERIEIVRGAASALYGSDALGGVVNIITRAPDTPGLGNTLALTGGSYSDFRVVDTLSVRGAKGGVAASGGYRTYDGFDLQPDNPQTIGQPKSRWWNGSGQADYQLTPRLVARFFGDYQDRHIDPYYFAGATQQASTVYNSIRDLTRYTLAPELELLPGSNTSVLLQYNYGRYLRDETRVFVESGNVVPQAPWREWDQELRLTGRWAWKAAGKENPLQGGYEFRREKLSRGTLAPSTPDNPLGVAAKQRDINVLWLQQEVNVGRLTLTGGVRYDDYSDFGSEWSPKASALFALTPEHRIRASFGHGFRPPYFGELYLDQAPFFVGNPDLVPESANTVSAGYAYASARAQVSVDYFYNKVKNGIVFDLNAFPFTYGNLSRYDSSGVNLAAAVNLPGGFTPSFAYTYNKRVAPGVDENGDGKDDEIGGYPKNTVFLKLLWQSPRLGLRANVRGEINGDVPPGVTDTSYQNAYQVWYAQVRKSLGTAGRYSFEVFAQVDNIFDERDLYRIQTCPPGAPTTCQEGAPITGPNDLLQVWIAPRTFLAGITIGTDGGR
jgi:outer membrane receptor for ferrienterochelin and colicins